MINKLKTILGLGPSIDYPQLIAEGAIILDVRSKSEFANGHVPGSMNIPVDQLQHQMKKIKDKKKNDHYMLCIRNAQRSCKKHVEKCRL